MAKSSLNAVLSHIRMLACTSGNRELSDRYLLQQFAMRKDEGAFAALMRRHGRLVWNVCRNILHHDQDAEDAFQATFLVLAQRRGAVRKSEALASWLHGVAQRIARQSLRSAARRRRRERLGGRPPQTEPIGESAWRALQRALDEEVQRLPERLRAPFVLCCLEGNGPAYAAGALGWKVSTVHTRLSEARQELLRRLARRGVMLSAALCAVELSRESMHAAVPIGLAKATLGAVLAEAAGNAATGAAAIRIAALAQGITPCMGLASGRIAVTVLLASLFAAAPGVVGLRLTDPAPPASEAPRGSVNPASHAASVVRLDRQGDPLPADALIRLGSVRLRHVGARQVAFAPDGKTMASVGMDHGVRLWDALTGKELRSFFASDPGEPYQPSRWQYCVAFSPDGKRLACGEYNPAWPTQSIRLWEIASGKLLATLIGHPGGVTAVAFSADGKYLVSGGVDQTVGLWDAKTGAELRRLGGQGGILRSVAFRPDSKVLATAADDGVIMLWDAASGTSIGELKGHQGSVEAVCFSGDGRLLASGGRDQTVRLWDMATRKERIALAAQAGSVLALALTPDGRTLAAGGKGIALWDLVQRKRRQVLAETSKNVVSLAFSPDGKRLASTNAGNICVWDVVSGKQLLPHAGHLDEVVRVEFLPASPILFSIGRDETLRWWDWKKGQEVKRLRWPNILLEGPNRGIAFDAARQRLVLGTPAGSMHLLDARTLGKKGLLEGTNRPVVTASFSPEGKLLACSDGKEIQLWDVVRRKLHGRLTEMSGGVKYVLFAPDGKLLVGGNQASRLWDVERDQLIRDLPLACATLYSVAFSPGSRALFCGNTDGEVQMWDVEKGVKKRLFSGLKGYTRVAISPDGRCVAGGGWRGIRVWETNTGLERRRFDAYEGDTFALAFTEDGRALASGNGDATVIIWDIPGEALRNRAGAEQDGKVFQRLWNSLGARDGAAVHGAIWGFVARSNQATAYLQTVLKAVRPVDDRYLSRLAKDLDSDRFQVRNQATKELEKLGEAAEPILKKLVAQPSSLEVRERAQGLLDRLASPLTSPEGLRTVRAIEALEYMGTPKAQALLQDLADGVPTARMTGEAKASLERLAKRSMPNPR